MLNLRRTRIALTASLALTTPLVAIAGCQTPGSAPTAPSLGAGAAQAEAYPGTAGHVYPEAGGADPVFGGPARYVAAPAELKIASVTASSSWSSTPQAAIDNNTNTAWASGNVNGPTFTLTLSDEAEVTSILLKTNKIGSYNVEASTDGSTWKTVATGLKNSSWNVETKNLPAETRARYLRLRFVNGGKQVQLFEIDVKGGNAGAVAAPTPAPSATATTGTDAGTATLTATASATAGSFVAARGIDGNTNTEWQSGTVSNPTYTLDRGGTGDLTGLDVKINPQATYAVEVSDDGATWRTAIATTKNGSWNVERKALPAGTTGRYIRFKFANAGKSVMVFEAKPIGTISGGSTPTTAPTEAPGGEPTMAPTTEPTAAPTAEPTAAPTVTPTMAPVSGPTISVDTNRVLHKAQSTILGTNRNHVGGQFPNGAAKLAKMRELTPTWGGGKYLYRIGHGPADGRLDYSYMTGFHFERVWNQTTSYPYDDIREGLKDANAMGAEQFHTINFGTSDPAEAGRYVSYLNKSSDGNRAKYPFAQQNVRMFELGNEIPWDVVRGHSQYAYNESVYAQRAKLFAQAMRANSDVPIEIGAVCSINSNWLGQGWSGGAKTVENVLKIMGPEVDFLTYHGYPSWPLSYANGDRYATMAQNEWNRLKLEQEIKPAIRQFGGGRNIWIANTEFFTHFYSDVTKSRGLYGALFAADTLTLAFNQDIRTAVEFCFDHGELSDAAFFFNNDPNNTTAIFKFQQMLAKHWGDNVVATTPSQIPARSCRGISTTVNVPRLAHTAATTGDRTWVMVTNRFDDGDVKANVALPFNPSRVTAYTLTDAGKWNAANASVTTSNPTSLSGYTFKSASVTIFEIER